MNIILLGAAGFLGTNLTIKLSENKDDIITVVDEKEAYFENLKKYTFSNVVIKESLLNEETDFDELLQSQDVVYHLVSTNVPTTSNQHISQEIQANILFSTKLFDACVKNGIKKVVFISSGGTVYGKESDCPLKEDTPTTPISSYGLQKVTIEKLLYLYDYINGLDYRIVRLANPYGPYQRPNGVLGAVTTFTYKALKNEEIVVYGDGSVVRDFIYIDDAIRGILNIVNGQGKHKTYNLGSGYGTSIGLVLKSVNDALGIDLNIAYREGRAVDVPVNYLDIARYEEDFGALNPISLNEGIKKTAEFMREEYKL